MNRVFLAVIVSTALLIAADGYASRSNSHPSSIRILTLDWTSQVVLSHIAGKLLQRYGYAVEYLGHASDSQWFMLSSGYADVQMEVWEGSMSERFVDLLTRQLIVDAGTHSALTREEWWFPDYVKVLCPGLPDWRALNGCADLFAQEADGRGLYFTGPWEKPDRARIRALDLDFDVVQLSDSSALRAKMEGAIAARQPIMIFNWTPNWVEAVHAGEFVEFPSHSEACEADPAWGVNPDLAWDCGNPRDGWLKKAVSRQLRDNHPCAYQVISRLDFDNQQIAAAAALVEIDGLDPAAAASRWLDQHPDIVDAWLGALQCRAEQGESGG
jgi:glycine betaine/proline transport system substrate-binding protein